MNVTMVEITCPFCKCKVEKQLGHVNRANKLGAPVYCSKCGKKARKELRLQNLSFLSIIS